MSESAKSYRTPLGRVRSLGSAHLGTGEAVRLHLTAVALVPLTVAFVWLVLSLLSKDYNHVRAELGEPLPYLVTLDDVFAYIRKKAETTPEGEWIVLRFAFPTRLKDARFPTRAELDAAAPKHPVRYNAGPADLVNTMALKVSGITRDTPNPANGTIVKDPKTGEPTGMLRNAAGLLKRLPKGDKAWELARKVKSSVEGLFFPNLIWDELGFHYVGPVNGHDYRELEEALARAREVSRDGTPVVIHALTHKGRGSQQAEQNPSKFHQPGTPTGAAGAGARQAASSPNRRANSGGITRKPRRSAGLMVLLKLPMCSNRPP